VLPPRAEVRASENRIQVIPISWKETLYEIHPDIIKLISPARTSLKTGSRTIILLAQNISLYNHAKNVWKTHILRIYQTSSLSHTTVLRDCFLVPRQDETYNVRLLSPRGAETRPSREGDSATSFYPSEDTEMHPRRRHTLLFAPRRRRIVESACVTRHTSV